MRYHRRLLMIFLRYDYRIFKVKLRLHSQLSRLWIAGKLIKLAFKLDPVLKKEMGF